MYTYIGIDSIRFLVYKKTLVQFINKLGLPEMEIVTASSMVSTQLKRHLTYNDGNINHVWIVKLNDDNNLANCIIIKSTKEVNKNHDKRKVLVEFAGLHQPTKYEHIYNQTYYILNKFIKRFKMFSYDIAIDFKKPGEYDDTSIEGLRKTFNMFGIFGMHTKQSFKCYSTRYIRTLLGDAVIYDKSSKEGTGNNWLRLETTVEHTELSDEIINWLIEQYETIIPFEDEFLRKQLVYLRDARLTVKSQDEVFYLPNLAISA